MYAQLMSKMPETTKSEAVETSPFDRLDCNAYNCPVLLRQGLSVFCLPVSC